MRIAVALACFLILGCTEQQRAKTWGGTATIQVKPDEKVVNATWKQDNLWVLTRPMTEQELPETYKFQEFSSIGVLEGTVIIKEKKSESAAPTSQQDTINSDNPELKDRVTWCLRATGRALKLCKQQGYVK